MRVALAPVAALILVACAAPQPPEPPNARPAVMLWSALPLIWGEASVDELLSGGGKPAPATAMLERRMTLRPIDAATDEVLANGRILLAIQPHLPTPAELVAVDGWVRAGGQALILADPLLLWESRYALGDPRRPPPFLPLAPLLAHWGLTVEAPAAGDHPEPVRFRAGDAVLVGAGVGAIRADTGACVSNGAAARCRIGRGQVIVVADADLLDSASAGDSLRPNVAAIGDMVADLDRAAEVGARQGANDPRTSGH